jgi:hypothetical protein
LVIHEGGARLAFGDALETAIAVVVRRNDLDAEGGGGAKEDVRRRLIVEGDREDLAKGARRRAEDRW